MSTSVSRTSSTTSFESTTLSSHSEKSSPREVGEHTVEISHQDTESSSDFAVAWRVRAGRALNNFRLRLIDMSYELTHDNPNLSHPGVVQRIRNAKEDAKAAVRNFLSHPKARGVNAKMLNADPEIFEDLKLSEEPREASSTEASSAEPLPKDSAVILHRLGIPNDVALNIRETAARRTTINRLFAGPHAPMKLENGAITVELNDAEQLDDALKQPTLRSVRDLRTALDSCRLPNDKSIPTLVKALNVYLLKRKDLPTDFDTSREGKKAVIKNASTSETSSSPDATEEESNLIRPVQLPHFDHSSESTH